MSKRIIALVSVAVVLSGVTLAEAQQSKKIPRIGLLLVPTSSFYSARVEAFRQGLRELGYVEGKNLVIEYRYAEGKLDRLPDFAAELVHLKVDLIVTASNDGALAAKKATRTIPVVFAAAADPVGSGLVPSLAQPGGNITGISNVAQDLYGKRLELLKESFPKTTRVAFLWRSRGLRGNLPFTEMEVVANVLGSNFNPLTCEGLTILTEHSKQQKGKVLKHSLRIQIPLLMLNKRPSSTSRQRAACQQCTRALSSWMQVV